VLDSLQQLVSLEDEWHELRAKPFDDLEVLLRRSLPGSNGTTDRFSRSIDRTAAEGQWSVAPQTAYSRSTTAAIAWPKPMHMHARP
jgi:hypothetical protein